MSEYRWVKQWLIDTEGTTIFCVGKPVVIMPDGRELKGGFTLPLELPDPAEWKGSTYYIKVCEWTTPGYDPNPSPTTPLATKTLTFVRCRLSNGVIGWRLT